MIDVGKDIENVFREEIKKFHENRIKKLKALKLKTLLERKNPYLYKALGVSTPLELATAYLDAFQSSSEETVFGGVLERVAKFACNEKFPGSARKATGDSSDLDVDKENIRYFISVKSGPNWADYEQKKKMEDNFNKIKRQIAQTDTTPVRFINGCCYGRKNESNAGYDKICGQSFWEFLTGDKDYYLKLIKITEETSKEKNKEFREEYAKKIKEFKEELEAGFTNPETNEIDWEKIVKFNSGKEPMSVDLETENKAEDKIKSKKTKAVAKGFSKKILEI